MKKSLLLLAVAVSPALCAQSAAEWIAKGDEQYAARAEGARGDVALAAPAEQAVDAYRSAIAADGSSLEARWKFLRGLYFLSIYTGKTEAQQKQLLGDGRAVGDNGIAALEAPLKGKPAADRLAALRKTPGAAELYYWSAVVWGEWALVFGKMAATRQGAAGKIRDMSQTVIDLDPTLEQGGGWRVLGRLHHQSPKVPFFTGWVDHAGSVGMLRKALAAGPDSLSNQFFVAEAILDYASESKGEAAELLRKCAQAAPRANWLVEDARYGKLCRDRRAGLK